jgi:CBS domain-containing protein/sporulation protein YlmC with PRC-barrel domain
VRLATLPSALDRRRRGEPASEADAGRRTRRQTRRILASKGVLDALVSLAGVIGRPVRNQTGQEIGELADVVARWDDGQLYPPVTGLMVKVGRRVAFVDASVIDRLEHAQVLLRSARLDLRDYMRRPGEVTLARDVLDHQLVDTDGVQVIRAADLYLAEVLGRIRLVGVDVSASTLLRRLGPVRWRPQPTPDRVIDWAAIEPFATAEGDTDVRLRSSREGLHRLRPSELADLLEDLRRPERQQLLAVLGPEQAADALEEMDAEDLAATLRDVEPDRAAELLGDMEPDEAAEALRDLSLEERRALLARMPLEVARPLRELLEYPEDRAGGFMTTALVSASTSERVAEVVDRLAEEQDHEVDLDAVAVVDHQGCLVADLTLLELLLALRQRPEAKVGSLLGDEDPLTVSPEATASEVADRLLEARRRSLVVVEDGTPVGRILADDLLDALVPTKGRLHFPKLLQ